jgi:hypothetical protein
MNAVEPPARQEEIARYLDGVRAALLDLPPQVRDELLEDLLAHLTEVAAESDESLVDRLGQPAAYAAELRATAGMEAETTRSTAQLPYAVINRTKNAVNVVDHRVGRLIGYPRARDFLVLLAPAWWVLRGYLVGMIVLDVLFGYQGVTPSADAQGLVGTLLIAALVVGSIKLGAISPDWSSLRRFAAYGATAILGFVLVVGVLTLDDRSDSSESVQVWNPWAGIEDVYPYDANGQPLTGVRLFDQNGNPIVIGSRQCVRQGMADWAPNGQWSQSDQVSYPLCPWPGSPLPSPSPSLPSGPPAPPAPSGLPGNGSGTASGTPAPSALPSSVPPAAGGSNQPKPGPSSP